MLFGGREAAPRENGQDGKQSLPMGEFYGASRKTIADPIWPDLTGFWTGFWFFEYWKMAGSGRWRRAVGLVSKDGSWVPRWANLWARSRPGAGIFPGIFVTVTKVRILAHNFRTDLELFYLVLEVRCIIKFFWKMFNLPPFARVGAGFLGSRPSYSTRSGKFWVILFSPQKLF